MLYYVIRDKASGEYVKENPHVASGEDSVELATKYLSLKDARQKAEGIWDKPVEILKINVGEREMEEEHSGRTFYAWTDLETTGLEHYDGHILEAAMIITNADLEEITSTQGVIRYETSKEIIEEMRESNPWVYNMHRESGLSDLISSTSAIPLSSMNARLLCCIETVTLDEDNKVVLAGSSVHFDRKWLEFYLPEVTEALHYRNFDVSSLIPYQKMGVLPDWTPDKPHRAYPDALRSLNIAREFKHLFEKKVGGTWE